MLYLHAVICIFRLRSPLHYVNYNVHPHTAAVFMVESAIVAVCGVRYD